jgi:hypothetical protein
MHAKLPSAACWPDYREGPALAPGSCSDWVDAISRSGMTVEVGYRWAGGLRTGFGSLRCRPYGTGI